MRTKHVHSEIVYALAATQNVPSLVPTWLTRGVDRRSPENLWSQRFHEKHSRSQSVLRALE